MKEKLSIGEFAKLRNITTETLRHYDRIDLLKPAYVDEVTGYRYYSILQYEELGTILELRQLGMSTEEIKKYFNKRNLNQSYELLKRKHRELIKQIEELSQLEKSIRDKIEHLDAITMVTDMDRLELKQLPKREIMTFNRVVKNQVELSYSCLELENAIKEIAPIVASNRFGSMTTKEAILTETHKDNVVMILFLKDKKGIDESNIRTIPEGLFLCKHYRGSFSDADPSLEMMKDYIKQNGYCICGDVFQIIQIDISVTDQSHEEMFEIQIPIKKC